MTRVGIMVAGAALAALVATPASAQRQGIGENAPQINTRVHPEGTQARRHAVPQRARHARSAYRARAQARSAYGARAQVSPGDSLGARDAAMRQCTELSRKYGETTWGQMQIQVQRSCMAERGFPE